MAFASQPPIFGRTLVPASVLRRPGKDGPVSTSAGRRCRRRDRVAGLHCGGTYWRGRLVSWPERIGRPVRGTGSAAGNHEGLSRGLRPSAGLLSSRGYAGAVGADGRGALGSRLGKPASASSASQRPWLTWITVIVSTRCRGARLPPGPRPFGQCQHLSQVLQGFTVTEAVSAQLGCYRLPIWPFGSVAQVRRRSA